MTFYNFVKHASLVYRYKSNTYGIKHNSSVSKVYGGGTMSHDARIETELYWEIMYEILPPPK